MSKTSHIPPALVDGGSVPASRGYVENSWFVEEALQTSRQSVRIERQIHEERSAFQRIAVYESSFFGRFLTLDGIMMFTERDEFVYHEMLVHVPLCAIPNPQQVLIIGGGDCGCLREALRHPSIQRVVQCDIDERVTRVSEQCFPWARPAIEDPRSVLVFEDGVRFIEKNQSAFDLIIIDSTDPVGPSVGLFLRDFYAKAAKALKPGGIMTAQTESPYWNANMVGAIYREIGSAFEILAPYMGWVPSYPSGAWSWAFASNDTTPDAYLDEKRTAKLEETTRYYNREVHRGAFLLPNFVRRVTAGHNPFEHYDRRVAHQSPSA